MTGHLTTGKFPLYLQIVLNASARETLTIRLVDQSVIWLINLSIKQSIRSENALTVAVVDRQVRRSRDQTRASDWFPVSRRTRDPWVERVHVVALSTDVGNRSQTCCSIYIVLNSAQSVPRHQADAGACQ